MSTNITLIYKHLKIFLHSKLGLGEGVIVKKIENLISNYVPFICFSLHIIFLFYIYRYVYPYTSIKGIRHNVSQSCVFNT